MVKKKRRGSSRAGKKKQSVKFDPKRQFMKILVGLALLVILVLTAGLLANRFLLRPSPVVAPKAQRIPIVRPQEKAAAEHHRVPDYEAFHREVIPPPPPITRIKPVTNGIPVAIIIDDIGYDRKWPRPFLP